MKTSEALRKAGDLLRAAGWCKNEYGSLPGPVCAVGAIQSAGYGEAMYYARLALGSVCHDDLGDGTGAALRFNDAHERSADEVLVAMDAAYVLTLQEEGVEPEDVL